MGKKKDPWRWIRVGVFGGGYSGLHTFPDLSYENFTSPFGLVKFS